MSRNYGEILQIAKSIHGAFSEAEIYVLYTYVNRYSSGSNIVEIGSFLGKSSSVLGLIAKDNNLNLLCIDDFIDASPTSKAGEEVKNEFIANMERIGAKYELWAMTSELAASLYTKEVDMLFIDGDHSRKGVATDRRLWVPKVKQGGVIAWHDYKSSWLEIQISVDDMVAQGILSIVMIADSMAITVKK